MNCKGLQLSVKHGSEIERSFDNGWSLAAIYSNSNHTDTPGQEDGAMAIYGHGKMKIKLQFFHIKREDCKKRQN